ncbi:MAG: phage tail protein [Desulfovibrio sp.]|nr:phage tail protein [Desulfovibrio sp.]
MASTYYAVLTDAGAALEARALALGKAVVLTKIAVGDANLKDVTPLSSVTRLVHEVHRRPIDSRDRDRNDPKIALLHCTIPADVGGWWIYEVGVIGHLEGETTEVLYAYANHGKYYKVLPQDGQLITHEITIPIIQSTNAELTIELSDEGYITRRDFLYPLRATWTIAAAVAAGGYLAFPSGIDYRPSKNRIELHWLGLKLSPDKDFQEVSAGGAASMSVKLLFAADAGDEFQVEIYK